MRHQSREGGHPSKSFLFSPHNRTINDYVAEGAMAVFADIGGSHSP